MMSGGFRVSDSTIETAARAACVEADWRWTVELDEHILSPMQCVTPIVAAALDAVLPSLVAEIRESLPQLPDTQQRVVTPCWLCKEIADQDLDNEEHDGPHVPAERIVYFGEWVARGDAG